MIKFLFPCFTFLQSFKFTHAQLSKPIAHDDNLPTAGNKFLSRVSDIDDDANNSSLVDYDYQDDEEGDSICRGVDVNLRWTTEVSSSVYATPLVMDLHSDGHKEVVVGTFVHYLEALEGADGAKSPGWPVFHKSSVHSSPIQRDLDNDGIPEIILANYDGEILVFDHNGNQVHKLELPRLRVRKDWYVGLAPDPVDHSRPDAGGDYKADIDDQIARQEGREPPPPRTPDDLPSWLDSNETTKTSSRSLQQSDAMGKDTVENEQEMSAEAEESFQSLNAYDDYSQEDYYDRHVMRDEDDYPQDDFWDDQDFKEARHDHEQGYVSVDAHVLCTPVIADIDNDGRLELVVGVSWFYDREYYDDNDGHHQELGRDVDVSKYIASGVVVLDLDPHSGFQVKWKQHLDLTTDHLQYRAYVYSSPTLADLDGDGTMEVIIGTSVGFLYVLNADGQPRPGWPIQMGEIQGQVAVADVNDDGFAEIVACDTRGNVVVMDAKGKEVWEMHLKSLIAQGAMVGDVDGDGYSEVVVGTSSGHVHALNGRTGKAIRGFPYRTYGRIMSPILITRLNPRKKQQHLVLVSFDGLMYIIDGKSACATTVDIGETSYSMPLLDDLDNDGKMDLVITTMNGNVYCFETRAPYHPLNTWTSQVHSRNGFTARDNWVGVAATETSRARRDIGGDYFTVTFDVVDNRPKAFSPAVTAEGGPGSVRAPYTVQVELHATCNGCKKNGFATTSMVAPQPGTYSVRLPCPVQRTVGTVSLEMKDGRNFFFSDTFTVSFHMHVYRLLKWLLALPFLLMSLALVNLGAQKNGAALPE